MKKKCDNCGTEFEFTVKQIKTIKDTLRENTGYNYREGSFTITEYYGKSRVVKCPACNNLNNLNFEKTAVKDVYYEKYL